jgi:hypothetical protein
MASTLSDEWRRHWTIIYGGTYFDLALHPTSTDTLYTTAILNDSSGVIWAVPRTADNRSTAACRSANGRRRRGWRLRARSRMWCTPFAPRTRSRLGLSSIVQKQWNGGGELELTPDGVKFTWGGQGVV